MGGGGSRKTEASGRNPREKEGASLLLSFSVGAKVGWLLASREEMQKLIS